MRVVLDTNVIVSGLNFPGNERLILQLALRGRFELCLSHLRGLEPTVRQAGISIQPTCLDGG